MSSAADKLADQLEEAEDKVRDLEEQIEHRERMENWTWCFHSKMEDDDGLPLPRLEIRLIEDKVDGYNHRWDYAMIYKHYTGSIIKVPLGQTRTDGIDLVKLCEDGLTTPFRDGVHLAFDSGNLGLPAFVIAGEHVTQLEDGWKQGEVIKQVVYTRKEST